MLWLLFFGLLVARNPGLLIHAEFWAEDGWAWYPGAYDGGPSSLTVPLAGYLQTFSRLLAWVAQVAPLRWAPTVFVVAALAIQALGPALLCSHRLSRTWPSAPARLVFALVWIALPNVQEVFANLTNTQWQLATLAFVVLMADAPRSWLGGTFDLFVLSLSGLSGPFCLLLLPVAAWRLLDAGRRTAASRLAVVAACSLVQGWILVHTVSDRTTAPLGADPWVLLRIIGQQVILAPWIGQAHMGPLQSWVSWQAGWVPALIVAGAVVLASVAAWRGPAILRAACLLGALDLAAALLRPQISTTGAQWALMQIPGVGQRYYYMPMLAWMGVLFWLCGRRAYAARMAGWVLVTGVLFGIWSDWGIADRQPTGFAARAEAFERSAPGTVTAFPINPLGVQKPMELIRR